MIDTLFGLEMQPNDFEYVDDIVITTESFEDHLYWIEVVLKELVAPVADYPLGEDVEKGERVELGRRAR